MKRGVLGIILLLLLAPLAAAFDADVTPTQITAHVQAGGYVSELVELHADRNVQVLAKASPSLIGIVKLTRHNDTTLIVHFLPPITGGEYEVSGQLILDVLGTDPLVSAGVQHVRVPLNITVQVQGKAPAPAIVDLSEDQDIRIIPLSADSVTLLAVVIAGIVTLNIVLRSRRNKRKK